MEKDIKKNFDFLQKNVLMVIKFGFMGQALESF
jgi:hypothetical protein